MTRGDEATARGGRARRALAVVLGSAWVRLTALAIVVGVAGIGAYGYHMYQRALTAIASCPERVPVDLAIADIVDIKRRVERYQRDPDTGAELELLGEEIAFLVKGEIDYQVWLDVQGDRVTAFLMQRVEEGCHTVEFEGTVEVADGVASVVPTHLKVGDTDLTQLAGGRRFLLPPDTVPDGRAAAMLTNVRRLRVEGGRVLLRLEDRKGLW